MNALDQVAWIIDRFEGSIFTEDPIDTGGATRWGVTLRTLQYYRRKVSGNRGLVVTRKDVAALSRDEAIGCITEVFVMESQIGCLVNDLLRFACIDYAIHSGWVPAIRALQRAVGTRQDGELGPITLRAANAHPVPYVAAAAVVALRQEKILALLRAKPSQRRFQDGWLSRTTTMLQLVTGLRQAA